MDHMRARCARDGLVDGTCDATLNASLATPFYMHTSPDLDHEWLQSCDGFAELRHGPTSEKLAEVGLRHVLAHHPSRTRSYHDARAVFVPIFEYTSALLGRVGRCTDRRSRQNSTHSERMAAALAALTASPAWMRCGGCDHFWASSGTSSTHDLLQRRMRPLDRALRCSMVGRHKVGSVARSSRVGGCTLETPYYANPWASPHSHPEVSSSSASAAAAAATLSATAATPSERPLLLQFAGSFDVCCSGARIRCALGPLLAATYADADVSIRPTVRLGGSRPPCTSAAFSLVANASGGRAVVEAPAHLNAFNGIGAASTAALHRRAADEMRRSRFCLAPAGDTVASSRLYSAVAAGCIPVLVYPTKSAVVFPGGKLKMGNVGAFREASLYPTWRVDEPESRFVADPMHLVRRLREMPAAEVAARQRAMAAHRADVLYDEPGSRVGTHFLRALDRCLEKMAREDAALAARNASLACNATALAAAAEVVR